MEIEIIKIKITDNHAENAVADQSSVSANMPNTPTPEKGLIIFGSARKDFLEFSKNLGVISGYVAVCFVLGDMATSAYSENYGGGLFFSALATALSLWTLGLFIANFISLDRATSSASCIIKIFVFVILFMGFLGVLSIGSAISAPVIESLNKPTKTQSSSPEKSSPAEPLKVSPTKK